MYLNHRVLQGASPNHRAFVAASSTLLAASLRVLGHAASPRDRFRWINKVLDGVDGGDVSVSTLRVECYEQLFVSDDKEHD